MLAVSLSWSSTVIPPRNKKRETEPASFSAWQPSPGLLPGTVALGVREPSWQLFCSEKEHEHRTFFSDTMGGRKKYIPLEITQKGSSLRVQSLSWTALLLCTLRFNNMIGAGAARLSLFGLAAVPVTVKSYIWTLTCYYTTAGKISNLNRFCWNIVQEMEFVHWSYIACALCVNGAATCVWTERNKCTFQICALAWWDSNPSLEKTSLIPTPCLTAEQGRKSWEEAGGSKRQRETLLSSRGRHTTHRIHDGSWKIFDPKDVSETTSA